MLIETHELDLANSGLAGLDEVVLLRLFATTQARAIVLGTGRNLAQIESADGVKLYPAFYRTRVRVPAPLSLQQHRTWDRVEVGVDVHRFGAMLLESAGALAAEGAVPRDAGSWSRAPLIALDASIVFVHDERTEGEARVDSPREGCVAKFPPAVRRPGALEEQRRIRVSGVLAPARDGDGVLRARCEERIFLGRDVQLGRALMFCGFTPLLDVAEQRLLLESVWPAFGAQALAFERLLDREIFYFGNAHHGESVVIDTAATLSAPSPELSSAYDGHVVAAVLDTRAEIHHSTTRALLATAVTRKAFVVPRTRANDVHDIQRLRMRHGGAA